MSSKSLVPKALESHLELNCVAEARKFGIPSTKLQGMGNRSMPDRIFWRPGGSPLLVEFKRPGGKLTDLQAIKIEQLRSLGYEVHVVDNREDFHRLMGSAR